MAIPNIFSPGWIDGAAATPVALDRRRAVKIDLAMRQGMAA